MSHLTSEDIQKNAYEIGAITALARFLEGGLANQLHMQHAKSFKSNRSLEKMELYQFSTDELYKFAVELSGRIQAVKV